MRGGATALGAASLFVGSTLFCPTRASADEPRPSARARIAALLGKAEAAAKAKQWEACTQAYTEALALEDAPRTAGELGLCEEQLGRFADAHGHLDRAMDAAPTEPVAAPWKGYRAALVRLRDRVALLFITASPPDAKVVLDGRPIGRGDGRYVAVEPGMHTIAARLAGYEDASKTVTVTAPSAPHIDLELRQAQAPAPSPPATSAPRTAAPRAVSLAPAPPAPPPWYLPAASPRGVLVSLAAVGVATAIASGSTSIALEVDRASMRATLSTGACSAARTPALCDALAERYEQRNLAFGWTIGATLTSGLLAGAAGIAGWLERDATRPRVSLEIGANKGTLVLGGSW